jgi:hypothetical protein
LLFSLVLLSACKKELKSNKPELDYTQTDYVSVISKYNYLTKSKTILGKHTEYIDSDSVPIILDLLLNYNATENSQNLEGMEIYEFSCDFPINQENMSSTFVVDSLYDVIYEEIQNKLSETIELNQVFYFVHISFDGRMSVGYKGITVLMKRGYGGPQVLPRTVPVNASYRAHLGIKESFGLKEYFGGQCGQFVNFEIGAPTILTSYSNYNLNLWQPAAPAGFTYIYAGERNLPNNPENTYDPNHPTFSLTNYVNNIPRTFYPTKLYACATNNSWIAGRNEQDPNPMNHFNTISASCINSIEMNYYLSSISSLAFQYQASHERAVLIKIVSDESNWSNCVPWASNPNPTFTTGLSIDTGICPQGQHKLHIKYKNLVMIPLGL